jgi:hypothetical protein
MPYRQEIRTAYKGPRFGAPIQNRGPEEVRSILDEGREWAVRRRR